MAKLICFLPEGFALKQTWSDIWSLFLLSPLLSNDTVHLWRSEWFLALKLPHPRFMNFLSILLCRILYSNELSSSLFPLPLPNFPMFQNFYYPQWHSSNNLCLLWKIVMFQNAQDFECANRLIFPIDWKSYRLSVSIQTKSQRSISMPSHRVAVNIFFPPHLSYLFSSAQFGECINFNAVINRLVDTLVLEWYVCRCT